MASATIDGKPVGVARAVQQQTFTEPNHAHQPSSAEKIDHLPFVNSASSTSLCTICRRLTKSAEEYIDRCPYYFGSMSSSNANKLVMTQPAGTFLLRNSSDRRYPYALTVQTCRGPKSIRVTRTSGGSVQLDCDETQRTAVRCFANIFQLIHYHVRISSARTAAAEQGPRKPEYMFTNRKGTADTSLVLKRSLDVSMRRSPQSLSTLCLERLNLLMMDLKFEHHRVGDGSEKADCVNCYVDSLLAFSDEVTCDHEDRLRSQLTKNLLGF